MHEILRCRLRMTPLAQTKNAFRPGQGRKAARLRGTTLVDRRRRGLVELRGLEPLTSTLPVLRSPG